MFVQNSSFASCFYVPNLFFKGLRNTINPFQSSDAIWHHTFNSVLHILQFLGGWKGLTPSSPKKNCSIRSTTLKV
jgi:hypothetical protein